MKSLKTNIYKNIASVMCSDDKTMKTTQNVVLFSRALSIYPSKSIFYTVAHKMIEFFEKNVENVSLIIDVMREEGEDEDIITNISFLHDNQTITTPSELTQLCVLLADCIKNHKILKIKESYIQTIEDMSDSDDTNIKPTVETLYKMSSDIVTAYNSANIMATQHTFDANDPDGMKNILALTKDSNSSSKVMQTSIKLLNTLLSPGYMSGKVYVYCGLPGNYKSGILLSSFVDACRCNEHLKETTNGKTPVILYITMENTMQQTVQRLWSLLFPMADLSLFSVDEAYEMINKELCSTGYRPIILYYGYREKSTKDIEGIISGLNDDKHKVVGLFFDYIKRIRPGRTDAAATSNEKAELNVILNEFKAMAASLDIPIVTGHQLNRQAAQAIDEMTQRGGFNRTDQAMSRSQVGSAWEVVEVADWLGFLNIENNGESKYLIVKAMKQRDKKVDNVDDDIQGIRHPFMSSISFALKSDINENCSLSLPIYIGRKSASMSSAPI